MCCVDFSDPYFNIPVKHWVPAQVFSTVCTVILTIWKFTGPDLITFHTGLSLSLGRAGQLPEDADLECNQMVINKHLVIIISLTFVLDFLLPAAIQ